MTLTLGHSLSPLAICLDPDSLLILDNDSFDYSPKRNGRKRRKENEMSLVAGSIKKEREDIWIGKWVRSGGGAEKLERERRSKEKRKRSSKRE